LLIIPIIDQARTETSTPMRAYITTFFAFFVFSSSHEDTSIIIPPIITAITAITATYLIHVAIIFPSISKPHASVLVFSQPGSFPQSISGIFTATVT